MQVQIQIDIDKMESKDSTPVSARGKVASASKKPDPKDYPSPRYIQKPRFSGNPYDLGSRSGHNPIISMKDDRLGSGFDDKPLSQH
jgi:hypothetical protein